MPSIAGHDDIQEKSDPVSILHLPQDRLAIVSFRNVIAGLPEERASNARMSGESSMIRFFPSLPFLDGFCIPDESSVLGNGSVTGEFSGTGNVQNGFSLSRRRYSGIPSLSFLNPDVRYENPQMEV
jgi:hypothetical protein